MESMFTLTAMLKGPQWACTQVQFDSLLGWNLTATDKGWSVQLTERRALAAIRYLKALQQGLRQQAPLP